MRATKASFLEDYAAKAGRAYLRFDYSGTANPTANSRTARSARGLRKSLAIIRAESDGPQILVGSSMGGWLALLCAQALAANGEAERLAGLVLIAPAADMTERLIWDHLPPDLREEIEKKGTLLPAFVLFGLDLSDYARIDRGRPQASSSLAGQFALIAPCIFCKG